MAKLLNVVLKGEKLITCMHIIANFFLGQSLRLDVDSLGGMLAQEVVVNYVCKVCRKSLMITRDVLFC